MSRENWLETSGHCIYCGQHQLVRVEQSASEEEINREAMMICDCDDARAEQKIVQNIHSIEKTIENNYAGAPHVQQVLKPAVAAVARGTINSVSIKQGKTKYVLATTKTGMKLEKTVTNKEAEEV